MKKLNNEEMMNVNGGGALKLAVGVIIGIVINAANRFIARKCRF